jgi:hypothetical protein
MFFLLSLRISAPITFTIEIIDSSIYKVTFHVINMCKLFYVKIERNGPCAKLGTSVKA